MIKLNFFYLVERYTEVIVYDKSCYLGFALNTPG